MIVNTPDKKILSALVAKYERSKSFNGENKVNQKFTVKTSILFKKYLGNDEFELFTKINDVIADLVYQGFIDASRNRAGEYEILSLNINALQMIYKYIGMTAKHDTNQSVIAVMERYQDKNNILLRYCTNQFSQISKNKAIQYFNGDLIEFENILISVDALLKVENETYMRDFSVKTFSDSKVFERIASKVIKLLYTYGDFPDEQRVLGDLNVIRNPTYVNFKGAGRIAIKGQVVDLSQLNNDIAISSMMLGDIDAIQILGEGVITIENLTSFHTFKDQNLFAVYLGGYHNTVRREFIRKIERQNPETAFYHFGDIDAGGFYIYEHLVRKTGVAFKTYKMDIDTIMSYGKFTKELTENDRKRLNDLSGGQHRDVVNYMLDNNCKLEQEAINVG